MSEISEHQRPDGMSDADWCRALEQRDAAARQEHLFKALELHNQYTAVLQHLGVARVDDDNPLHAEAALLWELRQQELKLGQGVIDDVPVPDGWEGARPAQAIVDLPSFIAWLEQQVLVLSMLVNEPVNLTVTVPECPLVRREEVEMWLKWHTDNADANQQWFRTKVTLASDVGQSLRNAWRIMMVAMRDECPEASEQQMAVIAKSVDLTILPGDRAGELAKIRSLLATAKLKLLKMTKNA